MELPFISYEQPTTADYSKQPTIDAIERKFEKLTHQGVDLSNLILIIQGYMNKDTATIVFADESFEKYRAYPFKGIYYVSPAVMSGDTDESLQDGYIVAIKDAINF